MIKTYQDIVEEIMAMKENKTVRPPEFDRKTRIDAKITKDKPDEFRSYLDSISAFGAQFLHNSLTGDKITINYDGTLNYNTSST